MTDPLSLADYVYPLLYTLFLWWFSTGLVLYLDGLPPRTFKWSFLGATAVLVAALYGLAESAADATRGGAYLAFTCAVLVWGWNEMGFLMGFITGPRREACPDGCRGWRHFGHAVETILYHELAIIASAALVVAATWGAPNQVGTWTFMVLWWMRLSAKLNVFLGAPALSEAFLPEHLRYLERFFSKKPMNLLFPVSITVSTVITVWIIQAARAPDAGVFDATGASFLATLMGLAILEHWLLVVPLPTDALWSWGLRSHKATASENEAARSGSVVLLQRRRDDAGAAFEQEAAKRRRDR